MGKASRDKGKRGEREARDMVRDHWDSPKCIRSIQVSGTYAADLLYGPPGLHLEVKRYAKIGAVRFMEQAERDAREDDIPLVLLREDQGRWYVMVPLSQSVDFARRIQEHMADRSRTLP